MAAASRRERHRTPSLGDGKEEAGTIEHSQIEVENGQEMTFSDSRFAAVFSGRFDLWTKRVEPTGIWMKRLCVWCRLRNRPNGRLVGLHPGGPVFVGERSFPLPLIALRRRWTPVHSSGFILASASGPSTTIRQSFAVIRLPLPLGASRGNSCHFVTTRKIFSLAHQRVGHR